jgi:hypothetical protein
MTSLRVLYIAGWGRSGSTLLDLMVGQHPAVCSVGELRQIWRKGIVENGLCGCQRRFHDCPFWSEVGSEAFGGWDRLDVQNVLRLRQRLDRGATPPSLDRIRAAVRRGSRAELQEYVDLLRQLVGAIHKVSGATVVADSSKTPAHALLLKRIPLLDLRMIHLVRDSRGVAFSFRRGGEERIRRWGSRDQWGEAVPDPSVAAGPRGGSPPEAPAVLDVDALRERHEWRMLGVAGASIRWLLYNLVTPSVARLGVPSLALRYEDLLRDPQESLIRTLEVAGISSPVDDLSFLNGHRLMLAPTHTVHGSDRLRFTTGELTLRMDEEWRWKMSRGDRWKVTAMTFPLLLKYRYALKADADSDRAKKTS